MIRAASVTGPPGLTGAPVLTGAGASTSQTSPQVAGISGIAGGILREGLLAGMDPAALALDFGTPLYVYDLDLVARRLDALRAVLPRGFRVAYAVKANPALAMLSHIRRTGAGADVASAGELEAVLRAGFDPAVVTLTGPGQRDEELVAAVGAGIGLVTVESAGELRRLEAVAVATGRQQRVLLRLAVGDEAGVETARLIGGAEGKFGMPLADLVEAARYAAASPALELMGIHAFGASNVRDADQLALHVADLVAVGSEVAAAAEKPLRIVDAGGGLGIPYADEEQPLDIDLLGRRLAELRVRWDGDPGLRDLEVVLEPGRFLVGPAGAYVARVVDVKGSAAKQVAILEGGINHVLRPALVGTEHRIALLRGAGTGRPPTPGESTRPTLVAGPLCTGIDVLATAAQLPALSVGDLVALLDVGAYGYTESMPLFLSHPWPAEVCVRSGRALLARPRMTPRELLDRQVDPAW